MTRIAIPLLSAMLLASSAPVFAEDRFALVIGANAGWSNDKPLSHAESDAEHVGDVLVELGGFSRDRVQVLRDPDTAEVRAQLRRLSATLREMGGSTVLFFYYSGHADERHLHLRGEPLSHTELYSLLRDMSGRVRIGVVDACKSGSILAAKGGRPVATFQAKVMNELQVNGLALLTSSGADELAQERRALAGSVFTHHLISGMRGAADTNGNGQVTLSEAYQYAYQRTEMDTAATPVPQRPAFRFELKGQGEVVLTRLAQTASSALVLPKTEGERYVVVDRNEWQLIAEARPRPDLAVLLALAPGEYRIQRVLQDRLESATVLLTQGMRLEAATLSFESRPLSIGILKGRPDENDAEALLEWRRNEALRLLAADEAQAALRLFDSILQEKPNDWASLRGRSRALVRMAEAYERTGDLILSRRAFQAAVASDPSLPNDPDFREWYQRVREAEDKERREDAIRAEAVRTIHERPRQGKTWGLGLDFGTRGAAALSAVFIIKDIWFTYLNIDIASSAFGAGTRVVPFQGSFSPFFGGGLHLGLDALGASTPPSSVKLGGKPAALYYSRSLYVDGGLQYMSASGFAIDFGAGLIAYTAENGRVTIEALPTVSIGWYF